MAAFLVISDIIILIIGIFIICIICNRIKKKSLKEDFSSFSDDIYLTRFRKDYEK